MSRDDYVIMKQLLNDVNAPINGRAVVEKLRQAIVNHDIPKIKTHAKKCLQDGELANGFMVKLFEKHGLSQTINANAL